MSRARNLEGTLVSGLIIVAIGVLLLLAQFGFFQIATVWHLWPLIFVAVGVGRLASSALASDRVWGLFMIAIGGLLMLHEFGITRYGIGHLWPLFIVAGGIALMLRSREEHARRPFCSPTNVPDSVMEGSPEIHSVSVFSNLERRMTNKDFRRAEVTAIFGGFNLDFTQADIAGDVAVIDATCIFGGGEIRIPVWWEIDLKGLGIFGGYGDKTAHLAPDPSRPKKTLVLQGVAIFGGIEIKN